MRITRVRKALAALGLAVMVTGSSVASGLAANTTVTVTPSNMQGWFFCDDQNDCLTPTATGSMVPGPNPAPAGVGSARLTTASVRDGQALILNGYQGTKLADITQLQFSTYRSSSDSGNNLAIALQFTIDKDVTDSNNSFQGRLVFEPYQGVGGNVVQGAWQTWSPMAGKWWGTGNDPVTRPFGTACPQSNPCTWGQVLSLFPNAGILAGTNQLGIIFKAGSGWASFDGNVDKLVIGVNGNVATFDFEPYGKDDCKGNGWKSLHRANGSPFKNQGDCVSHTNNGN